MSASPKIMQLLLRSERSERAALLLRSERSEQAAL